MTLKALRLAAILVLSASLLLQVHTNSKLRARMAELLDANRELRQACDQLRDADALLKTSCRKTETALDKCVASYQDCVASYSKDSKAFQDAIWGLLRTSDRAGR